jgi:F420-0:gamma-glutamyl ligase-like protein
MIAKNAIEEQIYPSILNMFSNTQVDYERISKIIVDVCASIETEEHDELNPDPKTMVKNVLLLILGLLHLNKPIDEIGVDLKTLPKAIITKINRDLQEIFP